jgi:hypothetical protein
MGNGAQFVELAPDLALRASVEGALLPVALCVSSLATSSDEMSAAMPGSPPIEVSRSRALKPRASIRSLRYRASSPLVSTLPRMTMCLGMGRAHAIETM